MIQLTQVSHYFSLGNSTVRALKQLSLHVDSGEMVAITGASGSGKSTLLNIMGCLTKPSLGRVEILGQDIGTLSDVDRTRLRRRHIAFIFQSFNLIPVLDCQENIEYPLMINRVPAKQRKVRVTDVLAQVGLQAYARQRPEQLSGGQRQRVAIARALVTEPQFVLADEPTANLDSATAIEILALMARMNASLGTAFIFATHDNKVSHMAQRVLALEDGAIRG